MAKKGDSKRIKEMLSRGQLSVSDQATGILRALYACCPKRGHESPVYRVDRAGTAITRVVFRCSICGVDFDASTDNMFLR